MPERPTEPMQELSEHEAAVFGAELGGECASVDLHGMTIREATDALDASLDTEFMAGTEVVKIIHGRGEQKLRKAVEALLSTHQLVEYWRGSNAPTQAGAVTYAALARK
ncbi:Smr/MutS family protein [Patescibacteria group bacterium]|nr:Smr/MutS family protein [Patescibacteria group bacterium]MBU1448707.1 Smr/MutS family protein [Patescibacteria group bacterium]MBU2613243.1 Smr/MutS family protein [Patescibacteria group bacterium]